MNSMAPALKNPPPLAKAKAKAIPKDLLLQLPPPQSAVAAALSAVASSPLVEPLVPPAAPSPATSAPLSSRSPSSTANLIVLPQLLLSSQPITTASVKAAKSTPSTAHLSSNVNHTASNSSSSGGGGKSAKKDRPAQDTVDNQGRLQIQNYLYAVSGQLKVATIQELEHDYAKPPTNHPDPLVRAKAAKFLFMKHFPRHLNKQPAIYATSKDDELVDVVTVEEQKKIPFLTPRPPSTPVVVDEDTPEIDSSITDSWTCEMNKLWTRANKILSSDRIVRNTSEGQPNEVLAKRNLQEQTAGKFRDLFASVFWDSKLIHWLHHSLLEHLNPTFKPVYLDSLQILRHKIPTLIETFYHEPKTTENKTYKPYLNDPLFNTLSHFKLKKLPRKPIFIIIPNGPPPSHQSGRLKYWHSMFSSMGKVVTIPVNAKSYEYVPDVLTDIRVAVNEKIRNSRSAFANRPLILVGFHYGSLIAAHCALNNPKAVCAMVCLGFPLKCVNGIRGELDDPLMDLAVATQFIIGENSVMTSLDDMEDFRERLLRADTSLIVVGGADDKLKVSTLKKRFECLTQSMVDRCVADEIYSFLSSVLINYSEDIALLDPNKSNLIPANFNNLSFSGSSSTPKQPKKKSSKKRSTPPVSFADGNGSPIVSIIPNGLSNGNLTSSGKPPAKRKRPSTSTSSSKPKSPRSGRISPLIIPLRPALSSTSRFFGPSPSASQTTNMNMNGGLPELLSSYKPALQDLASRIIFHQNDNTNIGKPLTPSSEPPQSTLTTTTLPIPTPSGNT